MGNEVDAFAKYLANGGQIHYYGNGDGVREFVNAFHPQYMHVDDAPDFFFAKDDIVILFEHFEFDCYKSTRKGSDHRRELARIQRKEATILPTEEGVSFHETIHGRSSYEDYLGNVTRSFNEHYSHIDQYINNLRIKGIISDCTKVKVMFFIEDVSPLGTAVARNDDGASGIMMVTLADSREFLDLLAQSSRVDYVLACSSYNNEQLVWFIDRADLPLYYEHVVEYSAMQFLNFEPHVISYKMLIPDNKLHELNEKENEDQNAIR